MNDHIWVHNLNPFLIQFGDNFGIRWYGLAYLTGFVVGAMMMIFISKRGRQTLPTEQVTDFITYCVLGVMIGGRVGYAVFYSQDLLTDFSSRFPYWGVLRVWEGGMASHGGIIGVVIAIFLYARKHKQNWMHLGDLVVFGGAVGFFFGRIANFINGELFGRECSAQFPFAVKFPGEMFLWLKHDRERNVLDPLSGADQLPRMDDAVKALGIDMGQWHSWISQVRVNQQARFQVQNVINDVIRAIQSGNEVVRQALGSGLTPRYPSQLFGSLLEGLFTFVVVFWAWRKPRKPGVIGALWLTLWALVRIIDEQFRMPDIEIGFQLFGLTRGQWLSLGQIVISFAILIWVMRRPAPLIAGWGPEAQKLRLEEDRS